MSSGYHKAKDPVCRRCAYRGYVGNWSTCDYILMAGHKRPPRVDGVCPVFEPKGRHSEPARQRPMRVKDKGSLPQSPAATAPSKEGAKGQGSKKPPVKMDRERALELYRQGKTDPEIGEMLGVHRTTVALWRRQAGLPPNAHGGKPCMVDGTAARSLYRQGLYDREIAERLGVSESTIARWRKREGLPGNGGRQDGQERAGGYEGPAAVC